MPTTLQLPDETYGALVALANRDGVGLVDYVGRFVAEAAHCELAHPVPGWRVTATADEVHVEHDDGIAATMTVPAALALVAKVRAMARTGGRPGKLVDLDAGLVLLRRGRGLKITDQRTGVSRSVGYAVADALASLVEREVGKLA